MADGPNLGAIQRSITGSAAADRAFAWSTNGKWSSALSPGALGQGAACPVPPGIRRLRGPGPNHCRRCADCEPAAKAQEYTGKFLGWNFRSVIGDRRGCPLPVPGDADDNMAAVAPVLDGAPTKTRPFRAGLICALRSSIGLCSALRQQPRPHRLEHEHRQGDDHEVHDRGDPEHHVPAAGRILDEVGDRHQERRRALGGVEQA